MNKEEIERCSQTLCSGGEKNKYYVYMLCRSTGQPFYIGKGQGRRLWRHEEDAQEVYAEIDADNELSDEDKQRRKEEVSEKLQVIREEGKGLKRVIVKWGLTEREAYMCESALINAFGVLSQDSLKNRVNGHASKAEKSNPADIKTMARTDEVFLQQCAIQKRDIAELGDARVAFIKINNTYESCLNEDGKPDPAQVKDAVRAFWPKYSNIDQIQYVFALYHQRVVGVFHVVEVKTIEQGRAGNLADYPEYPRNVRELDKLKSKAASLEEARNILPRAEYDKLETHLREICRPNQTLCKAYSNFQKRIYFNLDDGVPENVRAYENCIPTKNGSSDFIKLGRAQRVSVIFNF